MPVFMSISKHNPENCPAFSEKHRKSTIELLSKMDGLLKKHGLKMIGSWTDFPQHLIYMLMAGSFEGMQKLQMEPELMEWLSWNSMEIKSVFKNEEILTMLKMVK